MSATNNSHRYLIGMTHLEEIIECDFCFGTQLGCVCTHRSVRRTDNIRDGACKHTQAPCESRFEGGYTQCILVRKCTDDLLVCIGTEQTDKGRV